MFSIARYLPRSLYGRAALILLVPIVTIQLVVSFAFIQRLYEDVSEQMTQNIAIEINSLLDTVARGGDLLRTARILQLYVELPGEVVEDSRAAYDLSGRVIKRVLAQEFEELRGVDLTSNRKAVSLSLETSEGILQITFPRSRVSASNPHQLLVLMVVTGFLMTLVAYVFLRNQLRPIRRLARAAEAFGKGVHEPYQPRGANEVRSAGAAFLAMRARIERQMEQRTLMLSGVSHDLRTPLTRLKLGLSMIEETPETKALSQDVAEMEQLITAFLDFARAEATEELEVIDPVLLAKTIVSDAQRVGKPVSCGDLAPEGIQAKLRALGLRRALDNLINNAVRYGSQALVSVDILERSIRFRIEDDGPGISLDQREEALKPFARLDKARNQNQGGGVGLGLAIAADITRSHGGTLRLGESPTLGGLSAEIVLPR